jgi:two-component system sensor histidine kinase YesM
MRYNVSLSLKPTTLEAELQNLYSYVSIQNLMLNKRLRVDYDIPRECLDAHVPRLLLQPLVENSIKHGFSSITGNLLIHITASLLNDQLTITLSDNGSGMTEEELDILRQKVYSPISDDSSHGVGLWNVNQRLKLIFGNSELQFVSSSTIIGFTVIITIPQLTEGNSIQL